MADLVGENGLDCLSDFEISLLLLAAYLHDIGLTPERSLVANIQTYLLTGTPNGLDEEAIHTLTRWFDQHGKGRSVPLESELSTVEALPLSAQLTTAYCREMHADWSVRWIATHLSDLDMGSYPGWLADLEKLCLSHNHTLAGDRLSRRECDRSRTGEPCGVGRDRRHDSNCRRQAGVVSRLGTGRARLLAGHRRTGQTGGQS